MAKTKIISAKAHQNCVYCGAKFIPARRNQQKFCSSSCRSTVFKMNEKNEKIKQVKKHKNYLSEIDKKLDDSILNMNKRMAAIEKKLTLLTNAIEVLSKKRGK